MWDYNWKELGATLTLIFLLGACQQATPSPPPPTPTPLPPTPLPPSPTVQTPPQLEALSWHKIEPGGETRCAHNTPYMFWVRPGTTNNAFIFFQGGGGCFDATSCSTTGSYQDEVTDRDNPDRTIGGVFNFDNPENPFREDTMVYVPYCTGDVHSGNQVKRYITDGGRTFDIYHRGYVNASTALDWLYKNVPDPDSVFVTGCSAGSVASILHAPHIIERYPDAQVTQLGDSAGGLTSYLQWNIDEDYDSGKHFPVWIPGMQDEIAQNFAVSKFYVAVASHYPNYRFSQYNNTNDRDQRRYFVADGGLLEDFPAAIEQSIDEIHEQSDNFYSYTVEGERHCILQYTQFYDEEIDGVRFRDWVVDLANQVEVENVRQ